MQCLCLFKVLYPDKKLFLIGRPQKVFVFVRMKGDSSRFILNILQDFKEFQRTLLRVLVDYRINL